MNRDIDKNNSSVIETLIDIILIGLDFIIDDIVSFVKYKDLENRLFPKNYKK